MFTKTSRIWIRINAVSAIVIGIVHNLFTLEYSREILQSTGQQRIALHLAYFFAAMGTAIIACGILMLYLSLKSNHSRSGRAIILYSCFFLIILMLGAVGCGIVNPFVYLLLLTNLGCLVQMYRTPIPA